MRFYSYRFLAEGYEKFVLTFLREKKNAVLVV